MSARSVCYAAFLIVYILAASSVTHADIYRWNTGKVILGTEGIEPGPGADLSSQRHWDVAEGWVNHGPWNTDVA
jgi:hypothetical protein